LGGGRGRWFVKLFMLVNPTPKKKKSHLVRTGEDGLLFAELFMLMNPQKKGKASLGWGEGRWVVVL
jgi:hypothetical protein